MNILISPTKTNLERAARALADGKLVSLPTETVYGLGGNALMESAVHNIYKIKGRPAADPLICHVDCLERALKLWDFSSDAAAFSLISRIGTFLWPGPLTIVFKANPSLPNCVTGGSGFIGVRIPLHSVALELLRLVDFPVAAPSANTFGHVSPTTAQHVYDDLASRDPELLIIDGGSCEIGIESTVIKVNSVYSIEVLRRGKTSVSDVLRALAKDFSNVHLEVRDTRSKFADLNTPMDGPGQLLTHYSPLIPSSLITPASLVFNLLDAPLMIQRGESFFPLEKAVIVDYKGILVALKDKCLAYRDLSERGSAEEACFAVFGALRWTEGLSEASTVIFPFLSEWGPSLYGDLSLLAAVEDRLFRAASGTIALITNL